MRRLMLAALLVVLALPILPASHAQEAQPITLTDATGATVTITSLDRIISGSGDVTEIVYALGMQDHLVGIDNSATYPPNALDEVPSIGFARSLTVEPIAAMNPDLFLCTQTCSPDSVFEQLRQLEIPVVIIPDSQLMELADLTLPRQKIEMVAAALGMPEAGQQLSDQVELEISWAQTAVANTTEDPYVFNFYTRGRGLQLAAGAGTPADAMIRGAGGMNAATEAGVVGYEALSPEIILSAFPDWILLTEGNIEASGGLEEVLSFQGLNATPAVRNGQIIVFDTGYLLALSVRTGQALMDLSAQLHPSMTWERQISYPYSFEDVSGQTVTVEAAPSHVLVTNRTLFDLTRQLGFHTDLASDSLEGVLILSTESEMATWQPLRDAGALVVVVSDAMTAQEVAAALNVPGRALAWEAAQ